MRLFRHLKKVLGVARRDEQLTRPVAVEEPRSLVGSMTFHISDEELVNFSLDWDE